MFLTGELLQLINIQISQFRDRLIDRFLDIIPLSEPMDKDICELYLENEFFYDCELLWNEIAVSLFEGVTATATATATPQLQLEITTGSRTFYIAVSTFYRSQRHWFKGLRKFIIELLNNEFEQDCWFDAIYTMYEDDPV